MAEISAPPLAVQLQRGFQFPGAHYLGLMLTVATLAAVLVAGYMWSQAPDYRVLYTNVSDRDGGAVMAALQQMNVPYKFADGGALLVPGNRVYEVRLLLAGKGLPKGGPGGYELMETQKLGTSQFAEQINYQRALEGELTRSIETLLSVQNARVHLALSKPSAFMREQPKPSASIILNLHPGRSLDATQVSAIVHLVSTSVPDLRAGNITLVDQHGNLLSTEQTRAVIQLRYRQDQEQSYNARIEAILAPLTGPNNVRAQVAADLDFSDTEHVEEIHKPNQNPTDAAIRSQQNSEAPASGAGSSAGGVPGALSNQPPAPASAPITAPAAAAAATASATAAPAPNVRKDSTTNYEVDKTVRHTRQESGRIKRLTVAVVVNHRKQVSTAGKVSFTPLKEEEIAQYTNLVKQAVGYNQERGDTVSVINSAFNVPEKEKLVEVPLWKQPDTIELAKMIGKNILIAGVLLFVVLRVLRPILKTLATPPPAPALTDQSDGAGGSSPLQLANYEQQVEHAKQIARGDPKVAANVVKEWVSANGR